MSVKRPGARPDSDNAKVIQQGEYLAPALSITHPGLPISPAVPTPDTSNNRAVLFRLFSWGRSRGTACFLRARSSTGPDQVLNKCRREGGCKFTGFGGVKLEWLMHVSVKMVRVSTRYFWPYLTQTQGALSTFMAGWMNRTDLRGLGGNQSRVLFGAQAIQTEYTSQESQ